MWSDKVKAVGMGVGILIIVFLVWQWQTSKVTPEEIATTAAMKAKIIEQSKNYEALKKEKEQKIADIEREKIIAAEKAEKLENELMGRDRYYAELLKAKQTGDYEEIIRQADICYRSREAEIKLRESIERELAEVRTLYKKSDEIVLTLNEQMKLQIQATQECQEKRAGKIFAFGPGGGINASGEWAWGFFGILVVGGY